MTTVKKRSKCWHSTDELPKKGRFVYILLRHRRRWRLDYGYFCPERKFDNEVYPAFVEDYDNKSYWSDVKMWCYDSEFQYLIQKTFNRIRSYRLRKMLKNDR